MWRDGIEPSVPARQSSTLTTRPPRNSSLQMAQFKNHIGNPNAIKKLTINPNLISIFQCLGL